MKITLLQKPNSCLHFHSIWFWASDFLGLSFLLPQLLSLRHDNRAASLAFSPVLSRTQCVLSVSVCKLHPLPLETPTSALANAACSFSWVEWGGEWTGRVRPQRGSDDFSYSCHLSILHDYISPSQKMNWTVCFPDLTSYTFKLQ